MARGILAALGALALNACTMAAAFHVSEPHVAPDSAVRLDGRGIIEQHDRLTVSVVPENRVMIAFGIGLVVPIPVGGSTEPVRRDLPLLVEIKFEPSMDGFTFTPSGSELHYGGEVYRPVRASALDTRIHGPSGETRHVPGHRWGCFGLSDSEFGSKALDDPISLKRGCVILEFPVDTMHPSEPFSVHLTGVRFEGAPLESVEVFFQQDTRGGFVLMM